MSGRTTWFYRSTDRSVRRVRYVDVTSGGGQAWNRLFHRSNGFSRFLSSGRTTVRVAYDMGPMKLRPAPPLRSLFFPPSFHQEEPSMKAELEGQNRNGHDVVHLWQRFSQSTIGIYQYSVLFLWLCLLDMMYI